MQKPCVTITLQGLASTWISCLTQINIQSAVKSMRIYSKSQESSQCLLESAIFMVIYTSYKVFYQLLKGAPDILLSSLFLQRDFKQYEFLKGSQDVEHQEDHAQFDLMIKAMERLNISADSRNSIFSAVAAILHLGNIQFAKAGDGACKIMNEEVLEMIATLLCVKKELLRAALTYRSIKDNAKKTTIQLPLSITEALATRGALSKGIYERLFHRIIRMINGEIEVKQQVAGSDTHRIGVLDIYGFENFAFNSFEQFVINYSNEKLQQLFITLTLKEEQESYLIEGIEWGNILYFDNQPICVLIEEKTNGIISKLNEETKRPGDPTDLTFLEKLDNTVAKSDFYDSYGKSKNQSIAKTSFKINHYAGGVIYDVSGFLEKNRDELNKEVMYCLNTSKDYIIKLLFPESEHAESSMKRPDTLGTQLKHSMNSLMSVIRTKKPHYIRCINPNVEKIPGCFNDEYVLGQWKSLGLLENIHVRRAGFCFREHFSTFLKHFAINCPTTWPTYKGAVDEGVKVLLSYMNINESEYRIGKSMIFVRSPSTVLSE